jgi:hypothetical protein
MAEKKIISKKKIVLIALLSIIVLMIAGWCSTRRIGQTISLKTLITKDGAIDWMKDYLNSFWNFMNRR